jgi:NitT/TauT family transport system ATP-binding protein
MSAASVDIDVRGVSFGYPLAGGGRLPTVRDLSLTVGSGEVLAMLGPSGAGKSTLVSLIAGLLKPDAGEVRIANQSGRLPCSVLFQSLFLFPWATAVQQVAWVLRARGVARLEAERQALEQLASVGLDVGFARHLPHELSGGMQARLGLARVFATDVPAYLLDEPFMNLDPLTERKVELDFLRLRNQRKFCSLIVTHDVRKALRLADRILILSARPATVRAEFHVPWRQPRHGRIEHTPEFLQLEERLCEALMSTPGKPDPQPDSSLQSC